MSQPYQPLRIAGFESRMSLTQDEADEVTRAFRSGVAAPAIAPAAAASTETQTLSVKFGRYLNLSITARTAAFFSLASLVLSGGFAYKNGIPSLTPGTVSSEWKAGVDKHLDESKDGYRRIAELENWACRFELRFLQQNRWEAHRATDEQRVYDLDQEIARLQNRRQCQ